MGHWLNSFSAYAAAAFWDGGGDLELPVGAITFWSDLNGATPSGWALCDGTSNAPGPDLRNQFIVGWGTRTVDTSGGASTHVHADNLTHAGTAVANHIFTQPGAHSAHVFTQPTAHGDHTGVPSHVHVQNVNSGTTGALSGYTPDTSTSTSVASGYSTAANTGAANQVHTNNHAGGAVDAHSAHAGGAVDAHGVTQPSAHASHAATDHTPPFYVLKFIQRMT